LRCQGGLDIRLEFKKNHVTNLKPPF
jgi:hypothetical protein